MRQDSSTARNVALLASVALVIGAIGPWQTTAMVHRAGTDGDGLITLMLAMGAGLLVLSKPQGSGWMMLAGLLGVGCAFVGILDLIDIQTSTQELFGREVRLVSAGWGLWLTAFASLCLSVGAAALWTEEAPEIDELKD